MYVRYLLAYRLWKKLNKDVAVRNQINVTALSSLGTAPAEFHPFVIEYVLPKVPKNQKLTTKMLLLQKFEVEKSCEEFLNFCKKERGLDVPTGKDVETSPTDTVASAVVCQQFYFLAFSLSTVYSPVFRLYTNASFANTRTNAKLIHMLIIVAKKNNCRKHQSNLSIVFSWTTIISLKITIRAN